MLEYAYNSINKRFSLYAVVEDKYKERGLET
jgi:hypothetical protein